MSDGDDNVRVFGVGDPVELVDRLNRSMVDRSRRVPHVLEIAELGR